MGDIETGEVTERLEEMFNEGKYTEHVKLEEWEHLVLTSCEREIPHALAVG